MLCPECATPDSAVIDSRLNENGDTVRRRRECKACSYRFTTYERFEPILPRVRKSDNQLMLFDRDKITRGIERACNKRNISSDRIRACVDAVVHTFVATQSKEVTAAEIGEAVLEQLRLLDHVAFIRFASVYRKFDSLEGFTQAVESVRPRRRRKV